MKKNITVNLFGTLYAIDEDACKLLDDYLENMKRYFSRREGGEEIADDIEHRVAELLAEQKANGTDAISIEIVRDLIRRIGNPEEMDETNGEKAEETSKNATGSVPPPPPPFEENEKRQSRFAGRKLYRDPEDCMLGGVMSGLCHYFGTSDPLPWRIIMVVLAFFSFSTIGILYLIAWALIPPAVTAEQRLQMKGKPVNPQTLNEEIIRNAEKADGQMKSENFKKGARGFFGTLLEIILFCFKLFALFVIGCLLLAAVCIIAALVVVTYVTPTTLISAGMMDEEFGVLMAACPSVNWMLWGLAISGFIATVIILYALIRGLIKKPGDKPMSTGTRITLTVIAVLCVATAITLSVMTAARIEIADKNVDRLVNTVDGIYLRSYDRSLLAQSGMTLRRLKNVDEDEPIYETTSSLESGNKHVKYLEFERGDKPGAMEVEIERTESYPAGRYYLEAMAFAKGRCNYVYVKNDSARIAFCEIPVDDADGNGNMASMTLEDFNRTNILATEVTPKKWNDRVQKRIKGWSYVKSETFYHPGGVLTVGATNLPEAIGLEGVSKFSNTFGLRYIKVVADTTKSAL